MFPLFKPTYNYQIWMIYEFTLLRKRLIKLLNLTNTLHNFNNNGNKTEKVASKLLPGVVKHVGR